MQADQIWSNLNGLMGLFLMLTPFIIFQRLLHREIQIIFLQLTRKPDVAVILFAALFLPGVFLHELSHLVVARLVGVRTGRFSLIPQPLAGGQLRLGYVETSQTDWFRASLIGAAPLLTGGSIIAFLAHDQLHLTLLWNLLLNGQTKLLWMGLSSLPDLPYFWLWFYLTFVVSSTMLPSPSDRHAWMPLGLVLLTLLGLSIIVGAGPWMLEKIAPPLNSLFKSVSMLFGLSAMVHLLLYIPTAVINKILSRVFSH